MNEKQIKQKIHESLLNKLHSDFSIEEKERIVKDLLSKNGMSIDSLYEDILIGVKNGFSIEFQLDLIERMV